ncbi:hypothetical protein [Streptacidiphilus sp. P02-A3a]|uniref:hypothetical protein n=1 Tax=Streptacidiphilus sp. P02-A3a TaxID=2704468 RepID=UPI0015F959CD|nr:hypothetical protein [Streptacidiphilus sp. P02-A3a]QMU72124.1 hypothetical protein GXP74_31685 [Streptacidiphilus sp. P02-A3a]
MSNPNKARGTAWESAVRDYLNEELGLYHPRDWRTRDAVTPFLRPADPMNIRRAAQEGVRDVGDVHAVPFVLECKDVKAPAVPAWLRQAHVEAKHAGYPYGIAVHKTRGKGARAGRVFFAVRTWTRVRLILGLTARQMVERYAFSPSLRSLDTGRWYLSTDVEAFAALLADVRAVDYWE